jgi:hypothetical protein
MKPEDLAVYMTGQLIYDSYDIKDYLLVEHKGGGWHCHPNCVAKGRQGKHCPGTCTSPSIYYVRIAQ